MEDAEATYPLFSPVALHTPTEIGRGVRYQSSKLVVMLGSTSMVLELESGGCRTRLGFTGDLGRPGLPIIRDPEPLPSVDYLIMESTYGDRVHEPIQAVAEKLADIVNRTYQRGGRIIVPAFAVGRTQQLVLLLHVGSSTQNESLLFPSSWTALWRSMSPMFSGATPSYLMKKRKRFLPIMATPLVSIG